MKKKMSDFDKAKLIYSGELVLFAVVFLVLGILIMTHVISLSKNYRYIFTFLTLGGGVFIISDFIWLCCSKKRQKKNSFLDKALVLPVGVALIVIDLISIISGIEKMPYEYFQYCCSSIFLYVALVYAFQGIYHYKVPAKALVYAYEIEKKKEELEEQKKLENKDEEK